MYQLIARWAAGEDPISDEPAYFQWVDGRPATREDFEAHKTDTREYRDGDEGFELWIDFETSGDVAFDGTSGRWWLFLQDGRPVPLDLLEPDASDMEIFWVLADLDTLFRVRIHREARGTPVSLQRRVG